MGVGHPLRAWAASRAAENPRGSSPGQPDPFWKFYHKNEKKKTLLHGKVTQWIKVQLRKNQTIWKVKYGMIFFIITNIFQLRLLNLFWGLNWLLWCLKKLELLMIFISLLYPFLFFSFLFFGFPMAYGVHWPGIRSQLQLQPMIQLQKHQILNPLCQAGNWTCFPALQRYSWSPCTTAGTICCIYFLIIEFYLLKFIIYKFNLYIFYFVQIVCIVRKDIVNVTTEKLQL